MNITARQIEKKICLSRLESLSRIKPLVGQAAFKRLTGWSSCVPQRSDSINWTIPQRKTLLTLKRPKVVGRKIRFVFVIRFVFCPKTVIMWLPLKRNELSLSTYTEASQGANGLVRDWLRLASHLWWGRDELGQWSVKGFLSHHSSSRRLTPDINVNG